MMFCQKKTVGFFVSIAFTAIGFGVSYFVFNAGGADSFMIALLLCLVSLFATEIYIRETVEILAERFIQNVFFGAGFYKIIATETISRMTQEYDQLLDGTITIKSREECLRTYCRFIEHAKAKGNTLLATSMVKPGEIWTDEVRQSNIDFLSRGGQVERIFILHEPQRSKEFSTTTQEMQLQEAKGIRTWHCLSEHLPPEIQRDFIIDMQTGMALEFRIHKGVTWSGTLTSHRKKVQELHDIYEKMRMCAIRFTGGIM